MKAVVNIIGEINEETVENYLNVINNTANLSEIHFRIDSAGGYVSAADNIISHAKSLGVKITTEQIGKVMSAASKILAIGDVRIGNKGEEKNIMIHLPRIKPPKNIVLDSQQTKKLADLLSRIESEFVDTYNNVIKGGKDKILNLMKKETFMTNKEAYEHGLLTVVKAFKYESSLNNLDPVAYVELEDINSLPQIDNIMIDEKTESGIVDKVLAALEQRKEVKKTQTELLEVKASNDNLTKQLEDAKSLVEAKEQEKIDAQAKVSELESLLKASEEEKTTVLTQASELVDIVKALKEENAVYKAREESAADEEVLQQVPVSASEKYVASQRIPVNPWG